VGGVVEAMWDCARSVQDQFDSIVGMTYDWLSYFLTPYFRTPVIHWITVSSTINAVDREIAARFAGHPERLAFYSLSQARTFSFLAGTKPVVLRGAVDTRRFAYSANPERRLSWAARISPEKGLEDAVEVAARSGIPLDVCGKVQDSGYLGEALARFPDASVTLRGLLPHERLAKVLGNSIAMLATPKWTEAFGLSLVEAMACGTPVIAYARGGPTEIIESGKSGFLVEPDDTNSMLEAVGRIGELRRLDARARAEEFDVPSLVDRFERWVDLAMHSSH
jgi:UDP-glucose:tetrahydrobiopterin glucosyltransferase